MNWDTGYALEILPQLLVGFALTIKATLGGSLLALILGMGFTLARRSGSPVVRKAAAGAVEFLRRTPLLVQLFFIFYVLPQAGILLPSLWAGILALGLHSSAYMSEVYRAGIEAVPRGQWEAAQSLNYSKTNMWLRIILPQAIPPMIPTCGNYVVLMFKESALLSVITVPEAMSVARDIGNTTYRYLEPITVVGILYLLISIPVIFMLRFLENRFRIESV